MKRFFYLVFLTLGMGVVFSCEKETGKTDIEMLEGKWWVPVKAEPFFDGSSVSPASDVDGLDFRLYFEHGICTIDDYGDISLHPYTYKNKLLEIDYLDTSHSFLLNKIRVVKLTAKETIVDMFMSDYNLRWSNYVDKGDLKDYYGTFRGKDIYIYSMFDNFYGYFNEKGEAVACEPLDYDETEWYDTIRFFFQAL